MTNDQLQDAIRDALQDLHDNEPDAITRLLGILRDNPVRKENK